MTGILRQATGVAIGGRGVLIEGASGAGKSSLALALIDRGATLVGDDGVLLELRGERLWALPPPHTSGLLEIRNVGLVTLPASPAPVALVVELRPDAPRLPEAAGEAALAGVTMPLIALHPDSAILHLRTEWALALHGTDNAGRH